MEEILKLERLKLPRATNPECDSFFQEVSKETGAHVFWETGIKTSLIRKEPCIKITGSKESIQKAKDMLLDRMEMQSNRVVMKMDITHLEHPSLIGKGGKLVTKVMEATGCHIHFPDSNLDGQEKKKQANKCSRFSNQDSPEKRNQVNKCNRFSNQDSPEKSNQVSIYGEPGSVERARVMLRALIPIQMFFEVPTTNSVQYAFDSSPEECKLLDYFNGLYIYSAPWPRGNVIVMRCNQDQFPDLRKDIATLMEIICCKNGANLPPVQMTTQIVHHHHIYIKGNNNSIVEGIMKRTGAKIVLPDVNSSRTERNSVSIIGNIDCVYMAWQEIMSYLPVSVSFDIIGTRETTGEYLDFLQDCGITVYSRPKPRYYIKNVTVKGSEKFSKQMLQYRQHLLRLPNLNFASDIEDINLASKILTSLNRYFHSSLSNVIPPSVSCMVSKNVICEAFQQKIIVNGEHWLEVAKQEQLLGLQNHSIVNTDANYRLGSNGLFSPTQNLIKEMEAYNEYCMQPEAFAMISSQIHNQVKSLLAKHAALNENGNCGLAEMTAGQSSSQVNENKGLPETHNLLMKGNKFDSSFSEIDYYRKKAEAARAMRRPIESMESAQVPSSLWAGYGFSQSMPAQVIKDGFDATNQYSYFQFNNDSSSSSSQDSEAWENIVLKDCLDGNIWSNKKESTFSHSNYFDLLRNMPLPFDCTTKDILPELLWQHGLQKYIDLFAKQEINYETFLLLNDEDLIGLGISYLARVKLVCLIRELQDNDMKSNSKTFNAAPGAGRKQIL